ncbi:MAG: hypothetical protein PWQ06_1662 [Anaerophaga sp.]|nr:hypothetical protein [Anaerophaga sp.]
MKAIVKCVEALIEGHIIEASTIDDLIPYLKAVEKHYNVGLEKAPRGWVDVALENATRVYVATRNKELFLKTFYDTIDAYSQISK